MNPLNNINKISKELIKQIIEGYKNTSTLIDKGQAIPHFGPGLKFSELFSDEECFINIFQSENQKIAIELEFPKVKEKNITPLELLRKHAIFGGKKKSIFIEKLIYLKSLYEYGLIYFSEEKEDDSKLSIPYFTSLLDHEKYSNDNLNYMVWYISYPSLYKFVCKFYYSNVIPVSTLISFYNKGYITESKKQYKNQLIASYVATGVAFVIGILSPILVSKCSSTKINEDQFKEVIENIKQIQVTSNE